MVDLLKEIQKEIIKESSKEDIDVPKLVDLLCVYQILKSYQWDSDIEEFDIPKLSDLDCEIISYVGSHELLTLKKIYTFLKKSKSTISYHIECLIEGGILGKTPTIFKDKPIYLTDKGKEILLIIQKQGFDALTNKDRLVISHN